MESANAYTIEDIYGEGSEKLGPFDPCSFVLCDVYTRPMLTGKRTGMPIVYYKANTANNLHYDPGPPERGSVTDDSFSRGRIISTSGINP